MTQHWTPHHIGAYYYGIPYEKCPFCKSGNIAYVATYRPHLSCMNCGADGPPVKKGDLVGAFNAWNCRTEEPKISRRIS